jgi:hypothetical protein
MADTELTYIHQARALLFATRRELIVQYAATQKETPDDEGWRVLQKLNLVHAVIELLDRTEVDEKLQGQKAGPRAPHERRHS